MAHEVTFCKECEEVPCVCADLASDRAVLQSTDKLIRHAKVQRETMKSYTHEDREYRAKLVEKYNLPPFSQTHR